MTVKIITDSCCDLPLDYVLKHQDALQVLGMPIQIETEEIIDDLGQSYSHAEFYSKLRNGILPTTSQINVHRFTDAFKSSLEAGAHIIYIGFSAALSGTYNSALLAKSLVLEDYPDAQLHVIDTKSASIGLGVLVIEAVKMAESGATADAIERFIIDNHLNAQHWFGVDDLFFLKKGGRINTATAAVGTVLNVKLTLIVDQAGYLKPYGTVRGRKKSLNFLISKLEEHYEENRTNVVLVGHGNAIDDALRMSDTIRSTYPNLEIIISELSMTIASHVGPGMVAIAFLGKGREL
ncbi:DegV family protein [Fusibacter tunisiensis]|uniref:DegV family protein with EDD domain n=1 Tax=Fusibacter tunisiensis TaxID=1008308 RepID=A0ABS2MSY2_9FIRM|nr:DegV family protein [Fusibacter tunisiensis]MBM7562543.1 DegV family protein with EDD domain [Fusibacter tunisiensis]